jgi:hypothetical protein
MKKSKIYLETILFNYYFDKDRDAHADTVQLFKEIAAGKYEAFTSQYVVDELAKAPESKRGKMLGLISEHGIPMLASTDEARQLADIYVEEGIIPGKYRTDGLHIAVASVNEMDFIISMNFQHIVRLKTQQMTSAINTLKGYRPVGIISPMEIAEHENA